jgi:cation transporter-like permease
MLRKIFGWTLILGPAGYIAYNWIWTVYQYFTGYYAPGEFSTAAIWGGMATVFAMVPVALGIALLTYRGRQSPPDETHADDQRPMAHLSNK